MAWRLASTWRGRHDSGNGDLATADGEILHGETTDGGNLSRHIGGESGDERQLQFGEGGFIFSKTTSF